MLNDEINKLREDTRQQFETKFGNIQFDEGPHVYTINGEVYTPVSTIISQYENEFDTEMQSLAYALKNNLNQEDVKQAWKYKNRCATVMGTRAHSYGEAYTNMLCGHPELIPEQNKPQYLPEDGWLIPTFAQEFAVKDFYDKLPSSIHPIGAEFKMSTQYIDGAKPICGTADLLFYYDDPKGKNSGYIIGDWKSNSELTKDYTRSKGIMMKPPFDSYYDDALCHYYLQFNIYQRMMESIGLNIIARRLIHIKRDGTFEVHNVPHMDDFIVNQAILK